MYIHLTLASLAFAAGVAFLIPGHGAAAVLTCAIAASAAGLLIKRAADGPFLCQVFIAALLVRVAVASFIFVFELHAYFGGDAITYDELGREVLSYWRGGLSRELYEANILPQLNKNWGMVYVTAVIYGAVGHNMLAVQLFNSAVGAATAPVIYLCAHQIFRNVRVARLSLFFVAFWPSLVLWSAQGLKDGPIAFLLAVTFLATLRLAAGLRLTYCALLVGTLLCLLSLRFYIFYIVCASIAGAFLLRGASGTSGLLRQYVAITIIGGALVVLGATRTATDHMEFIGNLDAVQRSREFQARFNSGYGQDIDVSTTEGALSAIPVGTLYLLFAPFPWQLSNLRQAITLPEMFVWWCCFPLLLVGLWYAVKFKFREALPILLFTSMLTLAYAIFQGNVGTAYRQRSQLLEFYFIFVSVGMILFQERKENAARARLIEARRLIERARRVRGGRSPEPRPPRPEPPPAAEPAGPGPRAWPAARGRPVRPR